MPSRPGLALALTLALPFARAATAPLPPPVDSDHDGLSDSLEQALLDRFAPSLRIEATDCARQPARFAPGDATPTVAAVDGTLYGQAFPRRVAGITTIELHFYHLWPTDCGREGHTLDTEHVSALLQQLPGTDPAAAGSWRAAFWYAAAHEDTLCDASQITRAATLHAEDHGATVWISPGKHASFLAEPLCHGGCGADRCLHSTPLASPALINLGELHAPMNGASWTSSPRWPLAAKMLRSDFRPGPLDRLAHLPATDIAWVNPRMRPTEGTIAVSATTASALGHSAGATTDALAQSGQNTDVALSLAADSTTGALGKAYTGTTHALGRSATNTRRFLHLGRDPKPH